MINLKIITTKENLLYGIQTVQKAISTKNTIPILSGILLKAKDNRLFFSATDLEIGIQCSVPVQTLSEGEVVLPARYFSELVRKLPETKITLEYIPENIEVKINYGDAEVNLKGWPGEEFPVIPKLEGDYSFEIQPILLKNMIKQTIFAVSIDDTRPIFTGALFHIEEDILNLVTTDTHRLAWRKAKINLLNENKYDLNLIIPSKTLNELARIIKEDEPILVKGDQNQISFQTNETRIISRLIEGKFPNYKQVIPNNYNGLIRVKTKTLQSTLERASLFVNEKDGTSIVKLVIKDQTLNISSKSDVGKVDENIPIFFEGQEIEISFNAKYLLDVLKIIEEEDLIINLTGSLSPAILQTANHDNFIYLILPLRTSA